MRAIEVVTNLHTDDIERLRSIILPVAEEVAKARLAFDGIVVVVHMPLPLARQAMKKLGKNVNPRGTTVFGLSCQGAVAVFSNDPVTKRWCGAAPVEDQIKVFLIAGDGTALLTLNFTPGGCIDVLKEPDVYLN